MLPNDNMISRQMRLTFLGLIAFGSGVAIIGLIARGPQDDRCFPGGLFLVMTALASKVAYTNIWTGKVQVRVRQSMLISELEWIDKQDRPVRYWLMTIMWVCCSVASFVNAVAILAFSMKVLGDR
jgi:hypothetical protein